VLWREKRVGNCEDQEKQKQRPVAPNHAASEFEVVYPRFLFFTSLDPTAGSPKKEAQKKHKQVKCQKKLAKTPYRKRKGNEMETSNGFRSKKHTNSL